MLKDTIRRFAKDSGPLRLTLWGLAIFALFLIPAPGTTAVYSGWQLVTTVLVPVLAPMLFLVLLLDALMARVFLTDATGGERRILRRAMLIDLGAALVLIVRWLPFYAAIRI